MITLHKVIDKTDEPVCHNCGDEATIRIKGKYTGCHYCGNEISFCDECLKALGKQIEVVA